MNKRDSWPSVVLAVLISLCTATLVEAQSVATWRVFGSTSVSDVGVGADGTLWVVGTEPATQPDKSIMRWDGAKFTILPGAAVRIAVDPSGAAWVVNSRGALYKWTRAKRRLGMRRDGGGAATDGPSWVLYPLAASDVAVGAGGAVWVAGRDGGVYRLDGDSFTRVAGSAVRIAVDPRGNAWVIDSNGRILRWSGTAFQPVPHAVPARDISIAPDGTVFFLGKSSEALSGHQLYSLRGDTLRKEPIGGVAITAGPKSVYVVVSETFANRIYVRPHGADYAKIEGPLGFEVASSAVTFEQQSPAPSSNTAPVPVAPGGNDAGSPTGGTLVVGQQPLLDAGPPVSVFGLEESRPDSGSVVCPLIGPGPKLVLGCLGQKSSALHIAAGAGAGASPERCAQRGAFFDPRNGGECWTCPADFVRNVSPVSGGDACWKPVSERLSVATPAGKAAGMRCTGSAFFDPIDGGTCWTCPAGYRRTLNSVKSRGACALTVPTQYAEATEVVGCSLVPTPVGYGTAFQGILGSGDCYACPIPLVRNWLESQADAAGACASGGNTDRLIWKMPQYPEPGLYGFVPGLVEIAFANPKEVDAFLDRLAGGDAARKRALWSAMRSDPGASAAFKALLFAALVTAAQHPGTNAATDASVSRFAEYVRARRTFIAKEATRMWNAWQDVNQYNTWTAARNSYGYNLPTDVLASAGQDFVAYAWAGAKPDDRGVQFLDAASALSTLPAVGQVGSTYAIDGGFNMILLQPIFEGLEEGVDALEKMGVKLAKDAAEEVAVAGKNLIVFAKGASWALELVGQGIELWQGIQTFVDYSEAAAAYSRLVAEADRPVNVPQMVASRDTTSERQLLLFWALASSPHAASTTLGSGALTSEQLCSNPAMSRGCAEARSAVAAAMSQLGY